MAGLQFFDLAELTLAGACCALAWARGAAPERRAAACLFLVWGTETVLRALAPPFAYGRYWINMGSEAVLCTALLILALLYGRAWIGAAMIFRGATLSLYAMQWAAGEDGMSRAAYFAALELLDLMLLLSLIFGTLTSWRARLRNRSSDSLTPLKSAPA